VRNLLLADLELFGIEIDTEKNECVIGEEGFIHSKASKVKIAVMKTDEMGEIEREIQNFKQ